MRAARLAATRYMTVRHLTALWRQPWWIVVTLVQPIIWLLLFGALFKAVVDDPRLPLRQLHPVPRPGRRRDDRVLRAGWSGMPVIEDINRGVIDRFLVSPVRRGSLITGRLACRALIRIVIQSLIIVVPGPDRRRHASRTACRACSC